MISIYISMNYMINYRLQIANTCIYTLYLGLWVICPEIYYLYLYKTTVIILLAYMKI